MQWQHVLLINFYIAYICSICEHPRCVDMLSDFSLFSIVFIGTFIVGSGIWKSRPKKRPLFDLHPRPPTSENRRPSMACIAISVDGDGGGQMDGTAEAEGKHGYKMMV